MALRAKSSIFTAALGNPLLATAELAGAAILSLLAIIIPVIALVLIAAFAVYALIKTGSKILTKMSK
jgi:hypothetical protein